MSKLRRIIVGYDFSPEGDLALQSARILAERSDATLSLLHVVDPSPFFEQRSFPTLPSQSLLEEIELNVRAQLKDLAATPDFSRLHVQTDVRTGKPFVELIAACRQWRGDLIVVGVSGRHEGLFLGSTAERVLRKSPAPVLVAKRLFTSGPKTILAPTDFSPNAQQAAQEAVALARAFGGKVVLLHAMERRTLFPPAYGLTPVLSPITPDMLDADWEGFLRELPLGDGLVWEKQTREGNAAQTITDVAKEMGVELIVMGTHGRTGLTHMLLGSVTEKVVRLSECAILTVRPEAHRFELP